MFKLQPNPTFRAKAAIPVPGASKSEHSIVFEFRHKTRSQMLEYLAKTQKAEPGQDAELLAEIVAGWSEVDTDYSLEALRLLVDNYPSAAAAIVTAYVNELADAKQGN